MRELTDIERAAIVQFAGSDTFRVLKEFMEDGIREIAEKLHTTSPVDKDAVCAIHSTYVGAAAFYQSVIDRLNHEISIYIPQGKKNNKQVREDITEELLK